VVNEDRPGKSVVGVMVAARYSNDLNKRLAQTGFLLPYIDSPKSKPLSLAPQNTSIAAIEDLQNIGLGVL
jgi:hypothetical protein